MARKLDQMENLAARTYAKTDKRKVGDAIDDPISDRMAKAQLPSQMADLAAEFGIPADVIDAKAKVAPNLGQFRMTLGNMVRGSIARKERYETATKTKVDYADVATKQLYAAKMAEWRKSQKPVKDGSKVKPSKAKAKTAKAATEKTPTKSKRGDAPVKTATKRVKGLDGVERDVTHEVVDDAPKGAPSKADAAKRGKGGKRKLAKSAGKSAAAGRLDESGGDTNGQEQLANDVAAANA